jgi:RNA polymerase sigma-70 factor (ECF subfamily)
MLGLSWYHGGNLCRPGAVNFSPATFCPGLGVTRRDFRRFSGAGARESRKELPWWPCNLTVGSEHNITGSSLNAGQNEDEGESGELAPAATVGDEGDRALLAAIGRGSHRAFHALMGRHMAFVLRLARRVVGNRDDADEVAQEAFLRVWTIAPRWRHDGDAQFKTWLYRVVVNLCLDRRRRLPALPLEVAGEPSDPAPSSLERVFAGETARLVAQALDDLPPRQRAALVLCYYAGVSAAEAAASLDISVSALESLLVRGRRALRVRLSDLGGLDSMGDQQ